MLSQKLFCIHLKEFIFYSKKTFMLPTQKSRKNGPNWAFQQKKIQNIFYSHLNATNKYLKKFNFLLTDRNL